MSGPARIAAATPEDRELLLVVYVSVIALVPGITEIFVAFKLRGLKRALAAA